MAYPTGTILTRNEKKGDKLDVVSVVGPSPISRSDVEEWSGSSGGSIIVNPVEEFGSAEVLPEEFAQAQYTVTFYPEEAEPVTISAERKSLANAETPEQAFTRQARDAAKAEAKAPKAKPAAKDAVSVSA